MKAFLFLFCLLLLLSSTQLAVAQPAGKSFALVELFTSEGCSSCPPADRLMADLLTKNMGKEVYVLGYHVDYWDRLGWKDAYSNSSWSARQRQYANLMGSSSVYTPQAVVNGTTAFTGSEAAKLTAAVNSALAAKPAAALQLQTMVQGTKAVVHYSVGGSAAGKQLLVAVVQRKAFSNVRAGENAGKELQHVNVVLSLTTQTLKTAAAGELQVTVPAAFNQADYTITAFIQDTRSGAILAVAGL